MDAMRSLGGWSIGLVVFMVVVIFIGVSYKYFKNKQEIRNNEQMGRNRANFIKRLATATRFKSMREQSDSKDEIIKEMNDIINQRLDDITNRLESIEKGLGK